MARWCPAFVAILLGASASITTAASEPHGDDGSRPRRWLYTDVSVWDIAHDGRPFRFALAVPARPNLLSRVLFTTEERWAFSTGYARVNDSYDGATGIFKNPGGHAATFAVARQFRWQAPPRLGAWVPQVVIDFGIQAATRRFPADGTAVNFLVVSALEWTWMTSTDHEWTLGVGWSHFSNGNSFDRNAGYDGIGLRVGRSW